MAFAETIFNTRSAAWTGLGKSVNDAPTSADAIKLAGLDWTVSSREIFTSEGIKIPDSFANVRDSDNKPLGIVGNTYKIVQNSEAFSFTDALLGEGVRYETAGSLKGGKVIWLLAKMPNDFEILGDKVDPFLVFTNTHDGRGAVKVAMTNVRVICMNTLNMALRTASRTWSARHTGSIENKMQDAANTLEFAAKYMDAQKELFEDLYKVKLSDEKVVQLLDNIVPITDGMSARQLENVQTIRNDIKFRYIEAPDLKVLDRTGARFIQAVADSTSHIVPFRQTANFAENRFKRTIDGNALLDTAVKITLAA